MSKQDRQGARTPADLERRYNFGAAEKNFRDVMGIASENRETIMDVDSKLRSEFNQQITSLTRDTERIIMFALENYVETTSLEEVRQTIQSELNVMAERITMSFSDATESITEVNGELQSVIEELQKHFEFSTDGLTIKAGDGSMNLVLDNDEIQFVQNGKQFGWWDGVDFHTGNIVVGLNERAQFGVYALVPRSNKSVDILKVGD